MSQCVPNWDIDDPPNPSHGLALQPAPASAPAPAPARARGDYEVAELTWVNGHPSMHGMRQIRMGKPSGKYGPPPPWDKSGGTLESVVDQATGTILLPAELGSPAQHDYDLVPWITQQSRGAGGGGGCSGTTATATTGGAVVMDAMVPCDNRGAAAGDEGTRVPDPGSARCKRARDGNCSGSGSAASMGLQVETYGEDVGFTTSTTPIDESPETENTAAADEHDSASQNRHSKRDGGDGEEKKGGQVVRSSVSTKRSRAAAVHNQSERKRRDRINQRMKTLQKLVPNSSKTDKASMLDEVIDYLKQLQAQVQMMSRMTTMAPPMMMPMPMQQLQMAMMAQMAQMAQMGMGLGMAMGVDMNLNPLARPQPQTQPPGMVPNSAPPAMLHPSSFMPLPFAANSSWDGTDQRSIAHSAAAPPLPATDPFSAFMACQTQMPMNMDAFNRMAAAMYQQLYQQPSQQNPNPNK